MLSVYNHDHDDVIFVDYKTFLPQPIVMVKQEPKEPSEVVQPSKESAATEKLDDNELLEYLIMIFHKNHIYHYKWYS